VRAYCLPRTAFICLPVYDKLELGGQLIEGLVLWQVQRKAAGADADEMMRCLLFVLAETKNSLSPYTLWVLSTTD
jgi:hypothetical protein